MNYPLPPGQPDPRWSRPDPQSGYAGPGPYPSGYQAPVGPPDSQWSRPDPRAVYAAPGQQTPSYHPSPVGPPGAWQRGPDPRGGYPPPEQYRSYRQPPVGPSAPPPPNVLKRTFSTLRKHPVWSSLGALLGVAGVVISVIQLVVPAPGSGPGLEVAALAIGDPEQIDAVSGTAIPNDTYPGDPRPMDVTPVDITLKNNGNKDSVVNKAEAELLYAASLHDCTMSGAGPAQVTANYALTFPMSSQGYDFGDLGKTASENTEFVVRAGSVDRMQLTVGPEKQSGNHYPTVLAFRVWLYHDGDSRLDVGTVALAASTKEVDAQINGAKSASCAQESLVELDKLYAVADVRSPELDRLREKYDQLAG